MKVVPSGTLGISSLATYSRRQNTPGIIFTDFMFNMSHANTYDMQGIKFDQQAGTAAAAVIFVPHNQQGGAYGPIPGGLPEVTYNQGFAWGAGTFEAKQVPGLGFEELWFKAESDAAEAGMFCEAGMDFDGTNNAETQGCIFLFKRHVVNQGAGGSSDVAFRFMVVDGENQYLFSVSFGIGVPPAVGVSLDGGNTYKVINASISTDGDFAASFGNNAPHPERNEEGDHGQYYAVEVLFLNTLVQIHVGGGTVPAIYQIPFQYLNAPLIASAGFFAQHFRSLQLSIHPIKWGTDCYMDSNPLDIGFPPPAIGYAVTGLTAVQNLLSGQVWAVGFPAGSQITVSNLTGTNQNHQYRLRIENVVNGNFRGAPYSDLTAAVTRVGVKVPGSWHNMGVAATEFPIPKEVREDIVFDPQSLTIHHQMSFVLDNFAAQRRGWGSGNRSAILELGYAQPFVAKVRRFTGIAHGYEYLRPSAGRASVRVFCEDPMRVLRKTDIYSPPDMDGWNHYSAIAYLAMYAGIAPQALAFANLVPIYGGGTLASNPNGLIDPYSYIPAYVGDPGYFLPFGQGMHPWTPKHRAMPVLGLMDYIRKDTGHLLYFDQFANMRYEKWIPPSNTAASIAKWFREVETGPDGADLNAFWDSRFKTDTEDVRNRIVVIGVDAFDPGWNPIVVKREDSNSINNQAAANYTGFAQTFVTVDSRYANRAFAEQAADRMYEYMRVPEYREDWEAYMQPTLFPMMTVGVADYKSGADTLPFYLTGISTTYSILGGELRFRSNLAGVYITEDTVTP